MKTVLHSLILFVISLSCYQASASHMLGSDISWKCLGNDSFAITVTAYRDCNGAQLGNGRIKVDGNCQGIKLSSQTMSLAKDVTPICSGGCSDCTPGVFCSFKYGIEKRVLRVVAYVGNFKKNGCCNVKISWSQYARSAAITTVNNSGDKYFHTEAEMNVCLAQCDNSPTFGDPISFICVGKDFLYNQGTEDSDRDSLKRPLDSFVYSFAYPLVFNGKPIAYNTGYSPQKPLKYLGYPKVHPSSKFPFGIHLDSITGDLMFRPMKIESSVFAIKVEMYREGKYIGTTRRDLYTAVIKCPSNNPPVISGINNCGNGGTPYYTLPLCANKPVNFTICAIDQDQTDTVSLSYTTNLPGLTAVLDTVKRHRPVLRFSWKATPNFNGFKSFELRVAAHDNKCPIYGTAGRTFRLGFGDTSLYYAINSSIKLANRGCGVYRLKAYSKDSVSQNEWNWYINDTFKIHSGSSGFSDSFEHAFDSIGKYPITIETRRDGCWHYFYDTVDVKYANPIKLSQIQDTVICQQLGWWPKISRSFYASSSNGIKSYFWRASTSTGNTSQIIATYNYAREYKAIYRVSDSSGCSTEKSFKIRALPHTSLKNIVDTAFCGNAIRMPLKYYKSDTVNGRWFGHKGVDNGVFNTSLSGFGSHRIIYEHYLVKECLVGHGDVEVKTQPYVSLGNDTLLCRTNNPMQFKPSPIGGQLFGDTNILKKGLIFSPSSTSEGKYSFFYTVDGQNGCSNTDTVVIMLKKGGSPTSAGNDTTLCQQTNPIHLTQGHPKNGNWTGPYILEKNDSQYFEVQKAGLGKNFEMVYTVKDSFGCTGKDTAIFTVSKSPDVSILTSNNLICHSSQDTFQLSAKPIGGTWTGPSLFKDSSVIVNSSINGVQTYYYSMTFNGACSDHDSISVTIGPIPQVNAMAFDTLCLLHPKKYWLKASPKGGKWLEPNVVHNNIDSAYVILDSNDIGRRIFRYRYENSYGCKAQDSTNFLTDAQPVAFFTASRKLGLRPHTVKFTNRSRHATEWNWDLGYGGNNTGYSYGEVYKDTGMFIISLVATSKRGFCSDSHSDTIRVYDSWPASKNDLNETNFMIYPNPTRTHISVQGGPPIGTIIIYDIYSKEIVHFPLSDEPIDLSSLTPGIYYVTIHGTNGSQLKKKIIKL